MKKYHKIIIIAALILSSSISFAGKLPAGWKFTCDGTTGEYIGPNGSTMSVPGHWACLPAT